MNTNLIKLLLQLKNASLVKKEVVEFNCNSLCLELLKLLYTEGFIQSFRVLSKNRSDNEKQFQTTIMLRYSYNKPALKTLKIISTPSYSKYLTLKDISKIQDRKNILFLSTNRGLLTGLQCKKNKIGGTLLFIA
jgi:small subunit ribosomal protein S8